MNVTFSDVLTLYAFVWTITSCCGDASLRVDAYKKTRLLRGKAEKNQTARQRLPNALIIGVRKSGTRALLEFLNLHPLIAAASDEVHFFDDDALFEQGLESYRSLMPYTYDNQLTIEKTPAYFSRSYVPARVKASGLDLKFIVVFRNPVTRTVSDYTQVMSNRKLRNGTVVPFEKVAFRKKRPPKFDREVNGRYKAINISTYAYHMNNWLRYFPLKNFHFVDGDRLVSDPIVELRQVEKFLELPHSIGSDLLYLNKTRGFYCMKVPYLDSPAAQSGSNNVIVSTTPTSSGSLQLRNKCLRPDKGRRHPAIAEPLLRQLRSYFRPLNELLFQVIEKRFDWQ